MALRFASDWELRRDSFCGKHSMKNANARLYIEFCRSRECVRVRVYVRVYTRFSYRLSERRRRRRRGIFASVLARIPVHRRWQNARIIRPSRYGISCYSRAALSFRFSLPIRWVKCGNESRYRDAHEAKEETGGYGATGEAGEHNFVCTVMVKNGRTCCMQLRRLVYRLAERNSRRQAGSHA